MLSNIVTEESILSPENAAPAGDNRSFTVPTGIGTIHVHDGGPETGPTALLWPSLFTDGHATWGPQVGALHAMEWRTLLVDPPGTGASSPAPARFTMEACAEAAVEILDAAAVARAAFLGVSWGGFVALRVALNAPHRCTALVLSNTSADRMGPIQRRRDTALAALIRLGVPGGLGRVVVPTLLSAKTRSRDPQFASRLADEIDHLDRAALSRAVRSAVVERTSVAHQIGHISIPTLIIAGAEDHALPLAHSQRLAREIPGATLHVIPDIAHLAPREAPEAVAALLNDFLATVPT
jgi:3-oxoadipate enol-lactonase